MKILVTGASGFLGKHLCSSLKEQGHEVVGLSSKDADLTATGSLDRYNEVKFDRIYHLASWTQAGDFCLKHPGEQWIINQLINSNVLAFWANRQIQAKMIAIGTSCSYAVDSDLVEDHYLDGHPIDSLYTYAMTKRMLYAGLLAIGKQFGGKSLCVVPSTLYGEGYHTDGRQMHFIFDLIRKILAGAQEGREVVLWGDGYQKRELVLVSDFVNVLDQLVARDTEGLVNIGAGEEYTIREFAGKICEKVGYDPNAIIYDTSKHVGAKSKCLSTKKLKTLLPGLKLTPLDQGLSKTVEWYLGK